MSNRNHFKKKEDKPSMKEIIKYGEDSSTPINSDVILYVMNKNGYDLEMLDKLTDILSDEIKEYPHHYLYSIGNKKIKQSDGSTVLSGHYILISIEYIFKEPVLWYYSSQELSNSAQKEFKDFNDKTGIRVMPETDIVTQSVFNIIGIPNSECGLWCILFLQQEGKRPNNNFVKAQFKQLKSLGKLTSNKTTKQIISKDLRRDSSKILHNDLTLLKNPLVKQALTLQKKMNSGKI